MKMFTKAVCTLLIITSLMGCKKEKNHASRAELMASGPWIQMAGIAVKQSDGSTIDVYTNLMPCRKDDAFIFLADKSFQQTEGASKCDPASPQISYTGTWSLVNEESMLTISGGAAGSLTAKILELTATSLKMENTQGGYIVTVTYKH